jgi:DNA-directed RNA polymerase subunit beta'
VVWDVLEEVITEHPVLLNRAPTLHRLGIQAFEPQLIEGKAIQIHPLVCSAFNADFDGDQMAVHLPLSAEAQAEARILMLSAHNILSPAHGRPIAVPSQDMVIGSYYLTEQADPVDTAPRAFASIGEALLAYEDADLGRRLGLHEKIRVRTSPDRFPSEQFPEGQSIVVRRYDNGQVMVETTLGRLIFNEAFPSDFEFQDAVLKKAGLTSIVSKLIDRYPLAKVAESLDNLKGLGFRYATRAGLTISMEDVKTPEKKASIMEKFEGEADKVERNYAMGLITDAERQELEIDLWQKATFEVQQAMEEAMRSDRFSPIEMMIGSGARGNITQVRQITGMRGLVANPRGEIIPRPIKSNFREGLSVLEYFISTHGARKGLADTALRTADSGYLTRRLVDVAQELIVRENDCGTTRGQWVELLVDETDPMGKKVHRRFSEREIETKLLGRVLADPITLDGQTVAEGTYIDFTMLPLIAAQTDFDRVRVRSVLTCETVYGVCGMCYGWSLATGRSVELGEAIGIIAAQSIGEPGTQLTMRTFHTGGVASRQSEAQDITAGLPRVVELFEARTPKGKAIPAHSAGVVRIGEDEKGQRTITVVSDDGEEESFSVSAFAAVAVRDGQQVEPGQRLVGDEKSPLDPKEILEIQGLRETQRYLTDEVQKVYREQGVSIHDKHIEVIVRQMLRRVAVSEAGDSPFLPGEKVDARRYAQENKRLVEEGQRPAEGRPELMGITKASLATDSWLSAASFQETTRVLTEAAIEGRNDPLLGLKENVIIGKLIPAGTGMMRYRDIETRAPEYEPLPFYSSDTGDDDLAEWLRASTDARAAGLPGILLPGGGDGNGGGYGTYSSDEEQTGL